MKKTLMSYGALAAAAAMIPKDIETKQYLRDVMDNFNFKRAISPVSVGDNTAQTTQIFDCRDAQAVMLAILTGSIADADATFAVTISESDDSGMAGSNAVSSVYLNGTLALASFIFSDDDKVFKLGYTGIKRYIQATITPTNNASAALLAAVWAYRPLRVAAVNPPA